MPAAMPAGLPLPHAGMPMAPPPGPMPPPPPGSIPAPFQQPHRAPGPVPSNAPGAAQAPAAPAGPGAQGRAPFKYGPPPPPSLAVRFKQNVKKLLVVALAGLSYAGYRVYEQRQPYEWSGSVEARMIYVASRTGGRVKEVLVREGQQVEAGAVLMVLEPGELEAQRAVAEGDLEAALANLDKISNGARPEEVAQATARLAEARAASAKESSRASLERKELARSQSLYRGGAISAAEHEARLANVRTATGSLGEAIARSREAEAALKLLTGGTRPEDIRAAKAAVAVAKAKLAVINSQIEELTIRASRPSRVESLAVRPGDILRDNAPAAALLETGQLYVQIYVPETQLGKISPGKEVPVIVDSFPGRTFKGRVEHINELGEFTPHRLVTTEDRASEVFGARVALLSGDGELRAGMAAFVHVAK